jgi:DNA-binding IscR family transcriptional regulator
VAFAPALLGAAVAALLWETGKWGFTLYLRYSASYAKLYGSIALIPLSMLWVYVTWMIVLLGLQIAHAAQTLRAQGRAGLLGLFGRPDEGAGRPLVVDPGASLGVMAAMAANFRAGKSADVCEVAKSTGLDERVTEVLLDRLSAEGLLHKVQRGKETAFALARPPEAIDAKETLRVGHALAAGAPARVEAGSGMPGPYAMLMGLLENTRLALADGKSLADFLLNLPDDRAADGDDARSERGAPDASDGEASDPGRAELVPGPVGPSLGAMVSPGAPGAEDAGRAGATASQAAVLSAHGPENGRAPGGVAGSVAAVAGADRARPSSPGAGGASAPEAAAPTPTIAANTGQNGVRTPERPRAGV